MSVNLKLNQSGCPLSTEDEEFVKVFEELDVDKNGTLDKEEALVLLQKWFSLHQKNTSLKKYLTAIVAISVIAVFLLSFAVFGSTYIAVQKTKETKVNADGALRASLGGQAISTVSTGTTFKFTNSSDDTPLCIGLEEVDAITKDVLSGMKVIVDVEQEQEAGGKSEKLEEVQASGASIDPDVRCFHKPEGGVLCFTKDKKGACLMAKRKRGLRGPTSPIFGKPQERYIVDSGGKGEGSSGGKDEDPSGGEDEGPPEDEGPSGGNDEGRPSGGNDEGPHGE